jgi:hypothetical protein
MNQCPCGLTFEDVKDLKLVDKHGVCTAYYADKSVNVDGTRRVCGEDLLDHPHAPAGHLIHFIFLFLHFFMCSLKFIPSPISSVFQPQG